MTSTCCGSIPSRSATIWANARVEALAVRRRAGVDGHRAGDVHAHERRLPQAGLQAEARRPGDARRRQAADLRVGREADAAVDAARAQLLGLAARPPSTSTCSSSLSSVPVVVAGVVDHADRDLGREVLLRDEVLAPQLEPVHPELGRELVERRPRSCASPRAGPAPRIASVGHLVREDAGDVGADAPGSCNSRSSRTRRATGSIGVSSIRYAPMSATMSACRRGDRAVALGADPDRSRSGRGRGGLTTMCSERVSIHLTGRLSWRASAASRTSSP